MNTLIKLGKATVIGISGVTCGGKTSLTQMLKTTYPQAVTICQDDYFLPCLHSLPRSLGGIDHANWDSLESLDMPKMLNQVETTLKALDSPDHILIVDGFLIFNYPPLAQLCNLKYFITLPFDECWARRKTRHYDPPDPPGYFHKCVWPMYRQNFQQMLDTPYSKEITFLDGTASLDDNHARIVEDIRLLLSAD